MAKIKISQMADEPVITGDEIIPVVKGTSNKSIKSLSLMDVYSELTEYVVGKWVNGKLVYRKIITFTSGGAVNPFGSAGINLGSNVVDELVCARFVANRAGGLTTQPIISVSINKSTGVVSPLSVSGVNKKDITKGIFDYTKQ